MCTLLRDPPGTHENGGGDPGKTRCARGEKPLAAFQSSLPKPTILYSTKFRVFGPPGAIFDPPGGGQKWVPVHEVHPEITLCVLSGPPATARPPRNASFHSHYSRARCIHVITDCSTAS
jgi:hypothetical protein